MIKGIAHVAFEVTNMEEALKFYCEKLGFKKVFSIHNNDDKPWIEYIKISDGQFIELFYNGTKGPKGTYSHLCLEVEDINEIAQHLTSQGIVLDVLPKTGKDGNRQCWAKDPDGNRIEFMQMMPDSLQKNC